MFDVRREDNRHIAFGLGVHFCAGALLGRTEAAIAAGTAIKRFSSLRLANDKPARPLPKARLSKAG